MLQENSEATRYRSLVSFWQHPEGVIRGAVDTEDPILTGFARLEALESVDRMMAVDQQVYLPDDLLAKVDRASMAVSLEARVPLLDHRLVEWTWRLPRRLKIRDGQSKWILRQVLYGLVPRAMVDRPKVGFTVPIRAWLRGPLSEWAGDILHASPGTLCPLLDPQATLRAWNRFSRNGRGEANAIWALTLLQAWHRRWSQ
jgi:asparagine synthase (glutamine-hydrolysing)